jgi:hypothetical protein
MIDELHHLRGGPTRFPLLVGASRCRAHSPIIDDVY